MSVAVAELRALEGRELPGGSLTIEPHESAICDGALRAEPDPVLAHPFWFVVASLRCLGITVDDLCALAHQGPADTLLFGECLVEQTTALRVGATYVASAAIHEVSSRTTRGGTRMDSVVVRVALADDARDPVGVVTSTYLFRRGGDT